MPSSNADQPKNDGQELIRRAAEAARARRVSSILSRMDRDDQLDEQDGIEPDDSHLAADDSANQDSDLYDSSVGFDSSQRPSFAQLSSRLLESSEGDLTGRTAPEPRASIDATAQLSSSLLKEGEDLSGMPAAGGGLTSALTSPLPEGGAKIYRPTRRPPMAILVVYDDGLDSFEEARVRKTPFDVGRLDGDLVIGHELQMSRRHFRIDRQYEGEQWNWTLKDLKSLNGTFLKANAITIEDRGEVLIGNELVRFLLPDPSGPLTLMKVAPGNEEERATCQPGTWLVGSDRQRCLPFLNDNEFLDPAALQLHYSPQGGWQIRDRGSTNGLWKGLKRETAIPISGGDEFQAGEQRFTFLLS